MAKRKSVAPQGETKADKFRRLGNARLSKAVGAIDALAKLAGASYEHTDTQVETLVGALRAATDRVETAFSGGGGDAGVPEL